MMLQTKFIDQQLEYTGIELQPHYLLRRFGMEGDALAAFVGPCHVQTAHLVDWEDRLENESIQAARMVHFLGEFFGETLRASVLFQRLLVAELESMLVGEYGIQPRRVVRKGNDLYVDERKLNVSIVTASPVSTLMHLGINIDPTGAPVRAVGLAELGIITSDFASERIFAEKVLERFRTQWTAVRWACAKVRPVV